jgi:acyl-CoA synthetase (AMP-forming)/AMP-acid ligase II
MKDESVLPTACTKASAATGNAAVRTPKLIKATMSLEIIEQVEKQLLAKGSMFETTTEQVRGVEMEVFANRPQSLRELLEESRKFGDRDYVIFGDRTLTYEEHFEAVAACARLLKAQFNIEKGDRVAILGANCPEWVITFWAATAIGALPVGMNAWWVGDEIEYALEELQPRVIFADEKRLMRLNRPAETPVVRLEKDFYTLLEPYRMTPEGESLELPPADLDEDDPAAILFSSGTTGRPKGIVATHRNIIALVGIQTFHGARVKVYEAALEGREPDFGDNSEPPKPALVSTPLFHVAGLYAGIITRLATGGTTVWTVGKYRAERVLELIETYGIGGWGPTPTMVRRILDHPSFEDYDLSSLEFIGMGGSPVSKELLDEVRERIPSAKLAAAVGYGLTEACALISINYGPELDAHPTSVGRPLPTVEVNIRDTESGEVLPDDELGEICVRSPLVMKGYWGQPEESEDTFYPGGWLRTGDLGLMRGDYLFMPARRRDLIIRGGENIYPAEVERVLNTHPDVTESAVFARSDREYGEVPVAVVVPNAENAVSEQELRDYASEKLAYFKVPESIRFQSDPLPRNASGKILKRLLESGKSLDAEFEQSE